MTSMTNCWRARGSWGDAIHLLLQLGHRAALGSGFAVVIEQGFHRDAQTLGDGRQQRDRDTAAAGLVGVDGLLGDADQFGQLHLGDVLLLAQLRDPSAQVSRPHCPRTGLFTLRGAFEPFGTN